MRLLRHQFGVLSVVFTSVVVGAIPAWAAISLSMSLKNYYAEYEIVEQCARQAQLTQEDVETAVTAMAVIEQYYLGRDKGLNKARLKKQAIADKNDSFEILERSGESGFRPYCQMSLNELVRKAREVEERDNAE